MSTEIIQYTPPRHMTLDQSIRAWLDEKRADSVRTAQAYEDTLNDFRNTLQSARLDLDSEPALVAPLAQGWARASKREGVTVTPTTFNQRRYYHLQLLQVCHCVRGASVQSYGTSKTSEAGQERRRSTPGK